MEHYRQNHRIQTIAKYIMTSNEILTKVNDFIAKLPFDRTPEGLYQPVRYVLSLGGKRIRPVLMMLAYGLYKDDPERILEQACALETYHNYTLLHDDLMDNADLRRGKATVHKRWDNNTAILSGDTMLVLAYERMAKCEDYKLRDILNLFTSTALQIGEGQQYDMDFEHRDDVSEDEYIEMIRLKTIVLLACALKMGAILADADMKEADLLYKFGEKIGLAFQLQDDYLDVYGDPDVFGKAIGGDIVSNKKTYMMINAFLLANDKQHAELKYWLEKNDGNPAEKISAVTRLYSDIGVDKLALARIEDYFIQSKSYIDKINVADSRKQPLIDFTNEMMHRRY